MTRRINYFSRPAEIKIITNFFTRYNIVACFSILSLYFSSHSGDVFVGRMLKKNHPYRLPMLGHYIFTAVIQDLVRLYKINGKKTKVFLFFIQTVIRVQSKHDGSYVVFIWSDGAVV